MMRSDVCPACQSPLPDGLENHGLAPCPHCLQQVRVVVFPALNRPAAPDEPSPKDPASDEAACFYHEQYAATTPCSHCGRYLCARCAVAFQGRVYCVACLENFHEAAESKNIAPENPFFRLTAPSYRTIVTLSVAVTMLFLLPFGLALLGMLLIMIGGQ